MVSSERLKIIQSLTRFCCDKANSDKPAGGNPELEAEIRGIMNRGDTKFTDECKTVQQNMMAFIDGEFTEMEGINFSEHLKECELCNFIFNQVKPPINFEATELESIPVPDDLLGRIKQQIPRLAKNQTIREKIAQKISESIELLELILGPVPEVALRSAKPQLSRLIEHPGGNLVVSVGEPEKSVHLFTPKDVEIDQQYSDVDGIVSFGELPASQYKLSVAGHRIVEIRKIAI